MQKEFKYSMQFIFDYEDSNLILVLATIFAIAKRAGLWFATFSNLFTVCIVATSYSKVMYQTIKLRSNQRVPRPSDWAGGGICLALDVIASALTAVCKPSGRARSRPSPQLARAPALGRFNVAAVVVKALDRPAHSPAQERPGHIGGPWTRADPRQSDVGPRSPA